MSKPKFVQRFTHYRTVVREGRQQLFVRSFDENGTFATEDGVGYRVDAHGTIRRMDKKTPERTKKQRREKRAFEKSKRDAVQQRIDEAVIKLGAVNAEPEKQP